MEDAGVNKSEGAPGSGAASVAGALLAPKQSNDVDKITGLGNEPVTSHQETGEMEDYHPEDNPTAITNHSSRSGEGRSSDEESGKGEEDDQGNDDQLSGGDSDAKAKRAKRLAMNRASARERRRRKRIHTEELEKRVIQLSRQCVSLEKANEGLRIYTAKLEADLAQASAAVSVLSARQAEQSRGPPPPHPPYHEPPPGQSLLAREGALAATIQEQDRVRSLLGLLQQHPQHDSALPPASAPAPHSTYPPSRERTQDDVQRQVLDLLRPRESAPPGLDPYASLAHRGSAPPPPGSVDPAVAALLAAAPRPPPPPAAAPPAGDPVASYLASLPPPRGRGAPPPRMQSDYASPSARIKESALLASIKAAAERGGGDQLPPMKKRRSSDGY